MKPWPHPRLLSALYCGPAYLLCVLHHGYRWPRARPLWGHHCKSAWLLARLSHVLPAILGQQLCRPVLRRAVGCCDRLFGSSVVISGDFPVARQWLFGSSSQRSDTLVIGSTLERFVKRAATPTNFQQTTPTTNAMKTNPDRMHTKVKSATHSLPAACPRKYHFYQAPAIIQYLQADQGYGDSSTQATENRECLMVCVWVPNLHEEMDQNDYCGTTRSG